MKRRFLTTVFLLLVCLPALLVPGQKIDVRDLQPKYQEWLKLVAYIIVPVERDVFLKLQSDRDRDIFIDTFWKQRDPTPGTPENEYKDEIIKRFAHVNKFYGRATTREGWQTDLGRFYMILGEPSSIERFDMSWTVPAQAWSYYGDPKKGLPGNFVLLFFQRGGIGEYRLYDPVSDGPTALLVDKRDIEDPFDYLALYEKLRQFSPTIAEYAISRVPGEYNYDFSPSARNVIVLAEIIESPRKDVNPSYATHFLDYKGMVSTEYMTNYVESDSNISILQDPATGLHFVHFAVVPKTVHVDYYDPTSQYYCAFRLDVSLRVGDDVIFQYNRDFPLYFPERDVDRIQANGLAIEDVFPAAEGQFKLIALLQNSVGKEFSLMERDIEIPAAGGAPRLSEPLVGYRMETYPRDVHAPFKLGTEKAVLDPNRTFGSSEDVHFLFTVNNLTEALRSGGEIRIAVRGLQAENPIRKSYLIRLGGQVFSRILPLGHTIPAADLAPDYYEADITLIGEGGTVIDEQRTRFVVSPQRIVPHPIVHARAFPFANQFLYYYMLAQQYDRMNDVQKARDHYLRAHGLNPGYGEGATLYADFLVRKGDVDMALEVIERLKDNERFRFDYFLLRGSALMAKARYEAAIESFLEGNKIYNSDIRLLNALGTCYRQTGETTRAVETFRASLKLNPEQPEIKAALASLEK